MKDRYVILCDGLLIVCSQVLRRPGKSAISGLSSMGYGAGGELRFRDKYLIRLISIGDRADEEGIKWSFELCQRDQQKVMHFRSQNIPSYSIDLRITKFGFFSALINSAQLA